MKPILFCLFLTISIQGVCQQIEYRKGEYHYGDQSFKERQFSNLMKSYGDAEAQAYFKKYQNQQVGFMVLILTGAPIFGLGMTSTGVLSSEPTSDPAVGVAVLGVSMVATGIYLGFRKKYNRDKAIERVNSTGGFKINAGRYGIGVVYRF